jgi:hypothetical protein
MYHFGRASDNFRIASALFFPLRSSLGHLLKRLAVDQAEDLSRR